MRFSLVAYFIVLSAAMRQAQTGPCADLRRGYLPDPDAFSHTSIRSLLSFSDRTNFKNSGDTAYQHATVHVSCDSKEGHPEFEAVMLLVYRLKAIFARWWP